MQRRIAALVLVPLLLVAGCDPAGEASGQPSTTPLPASSAPVTTTSSSPPGSTVPSGSQAEAAPCRTSELKISVQGAPGGGAAGSTYAWLVFTNVSARTCSLYGYPGVARLAGPEGPQVNDPLDHMGATTPTRVVLAPQASSHAVIQEGHPEAFEPNCHAVAIAGLRVYPPDETAAVFVPFAERACSAKGVDVGFVAPIVAGLSE
ncbi:DUF4232 domain-containing protein [Dactylosporangium salmoneum]|uniref:DUF4232 domain-containing protein n=1 Tax=Dactylosporangium salmoneum TaxID=53361 RepID=A0ABN3FGH0_9ACTN